MFRWNTCLNTRVQPNALYRIVTLKTPLRTQSTQGRIMRSAGAGPAGTPEPGSPNLYIGISSRSAQAMLALCRGAGHACQPYAYRPFSHQWGEKTTGRQQNRPARESRANRSRRDNCHERADGRELAVRRTLDFEPKRSWRSILRLSHRVMR
jgi:hypothetical protein